MHTLVVRHVEGLEPAQFVVQRAADGKAGTPVEVRSPVDWPVEGQPGGLLAELRWYLEEFLDYPFPPWTTRATRVEAAVRAWGRAAFEALFGGGRVRDFYRDAVREGPEKLHVQVRSDDPRVLTWPWEALEDGEAAPLALTGRLERSIDRVADPTPLSADLPRDRVNVLLVIARPFARDVGYRSIARSLVELVETRGLPAQVTVLRPPTFARLQALLEEHPNTFHLLHFDGHGGYGGATGPAGVDAHRLQAFQGRLVFETEGGEADAIDAGQLADLLRVHRLPTVVLNACRSGMIDEHAEDPFASVAAALLKGGVRSVVAMAWSLYVSGAQHFLPAYYEALFKSGDVGAATRAGRRKMREQPGRVCARGKFPLWDWLVPVVYQQAPFDFSFATVGSRPEARAALPAEASDDANPHGFVGRDSAVLALERAMRRGPAGLLLHGLGGVGKTTLARGFLHWLAQTGGLENRAFWFTFNDIRSAEHVVNQMLGMLFDTNALIPPIEVKIDTLARVLRERPYIVVWDNFESARGVEGTPERGLLHEDDLAWLKQLLMKLRGGRTKVLITSRSDEAWLGVENRFRLDLGGLQGEERWEFCEVILDDLGRKANRKDPGLIELMNALDGHPLMMRMVLPRMEEMSAAQILVAVRGNLMALGLAGDTLHEKITATLRFVEQGLPEALRPLCIPLALHDRFVVTGDLVAMGAAVSTSWTTECVERFLQMLAIAGLVTSRGQGVHELHPALTGYLRATVVGSDMASWECAFIHRMAGTAQSVTPLLLHEQRGIFVVHQGNFHHARQLAEMRCMEMDALALMQALAAYAQNSRDFTEAERLFAALAERTHERDYRGEVAAYHQLGMIAEERREFDVAERWYHQALAVSQKHDYESTIASIYHQLGAVAAERRDFNAAEEWYLKSLAIAEKQGSDGGLASTYHQLGVLAQERRDFDTAENWYHKSLAIEETLGNEHGVAGTYHQLGMVAEEKKELDEAETWYRRSLVISESHKDEDQVASSYHHLGRVAERRRTYEVAEKWYLKSLEISERQNNEHCSGITYHHLGMIATARNDFDSGEKWYLKSLAISERQGNEHGAASTYGQLGILAFLCGEHEGAAVWMIRCVRAFLAAGDAVGVQRNALNFLRNESAAAVELRPRLRAMWSNAGLPPLPTQGDGET